MSEPISHSASPKKGNPAEKKILLVDDDEHVRTMLQAHLEAEGFQVRTAKDGKQILALALSFSPDLVISDVMMPGSGGYDVLRALQSDYLTMKIPVIIMSGATFDKTTKQVIGQESNVVGYFDKPLYFPTFMNKIHSILKTQSYEERMLEERQRAGDIDIGPFNS